MKLGSIPFDGLFTVYARTKSGDMKRIAYGFAPDDLPEKLKNVDVIRLYPFDNSIIAEVMEE